MTFAGPLDDVDVFVELGYYAPGSDLTAWDVAQWDTAAATWEGAAPLHDISCDVISVTWTQGRDQPLDRFRTGTCAVVVDDPAGALSPWSSAASPSEYAAIRPGIDLVVSVDLNDGNPRIPRFTGVVDSIVDVWPSPSPDMDPPHRVTFRALDYLQDLAVYDGYEQAPAGAGELTGARIGRILDNAGNTRARNIDAGTVTVQATTLAQNALEEAGLTTDTERGALWCDRAGVIQFRDRNGLATTPRYGTVQAVFGEHPGLGMVQPPTSAASAATTWGANVPANAIDGDPVGTWWQPVAGSGAVSILFYRPAGALAVGGIRHRWAALGFQAIDYDVLGWTGSSWDFLTSVTGNASLDRTDTFDAATHSIIALQIYGYTPDGGDPYAHLMLLDVQLFEAPEVCFSDVALVSDAAKVRNIVTVSRSGGTAVTHDDQTSIALYGHRTYRRLDLLHETDAQSAVIADEMLDAFAYAENRIPSLHVDLEVHPGDAPAVLPLDVLDRIELRRRTTGLQIVAALQIQAITETITGSRWSLDFATFAAGTVFDVARWDSHALWDHGLWGY